jgi:hypothetical protein
MNSRKVAIHQSQYIPWTPYFAKIASADVFVVMDDLQFQKNGVQNRNRIRNKESDFWLTIPVTGHLSDSIEEKKVANKEWKERHWKSIQMAYSNAPQWRHYASGLCELYSRDYSTLGQINDSFFHYIISELNIGTEIVYLSQLNVKGEKTALLLQICKTLGAGYYISGPGGRGYLDEEAFSECGIKVVYKESLPAVYRQFHGDFIPALSMLDMMLNVGQSEIGEYLSGKSFYDRCSAGIS